jgi:hypothetical protein
MPQPADRWLGDPTWYRLSYSIAAQWLHTGSEPAAERNLARIELGAPLDALFRELPTPRGVPGLEDESSGFKQAELEAEALVRATADALKRSGWRRPGRTPNRLWRKIRGGPLRRRELAEFVDRTVEPCAVIVYWSSRAARGMPPEATPGLREGPDRKRPIDEAWLADYHDWLVERRRLGYRVHYNLACLHSRLAWLGVGVKRVAGPTAPAQVALNQLAACFGDLEGRKRARISRWAWRDPGLEALRELEPREFAAIVGDEPGA